MRTAHAARALLESFRKGDFNSGAQILEEILASQMQNVTTATKTLEASGINVPQVVTVNRAAGSTITLPAATGSGTRIQIIVGTTITSNNLIVQVADNTDIMTGGAWNAQDAADTVVMWETAADSDTITMNGTTKGGLKGDSIELVDIAANTWWVRVMGAATGTEATPFSAAV